MTGWPLFFTVVGIVTLVYGFVFGVLPLMEVRR